MSSTSEIKKGAVIVQNNELWIVTEFQHVNPGKGAAFVRTRIKNAKTGKTLETTYKTSESITFADLEYHNMSYLFHDNTGYTFMDSKSYDQVTMADEEVGDMAQYLREGLEVTISMHDSSPISLQLPQKMAFKITETTPAVKGDTASGNVTKEAKTDNGFMVQIPLFINQDDSVIINTDTGEYVERAK
ncbi:MAG: elongation factor P [Patescibacteria group bacterium]